MKVGIVLGAGGVQGGAWLTGALDALAEETGWDPATADVIVGTSAGSMIGSLLAAGLPPWFMVAHSAGERFEGITDARGEPAEESDTSAGAHFHPEQGAIPWFPGSPGLIARSLLRPHRHTPGGVIAGWLPRGIISNEPLREIIRSAVPGAWSLHPNHWVVACDYSTGRRVCFGRDDSPRVRLEDAVAASCAIPGFYQPVPIGDRTYVDGGIWSTSNIDVLRKRGLDLVISLNPTSTLHPLRALNLRSAVRLLTHRGPGRRLGHEARKLRDEGTSVVLIQPTGADLQAMGLNLMAAGNRNEVIRVARETTRSQLAAADPDRLLAELPPGDPDMVRRPDRADGEWPVLEQLRERVAVAAAGRS